MKPDQKADHLNDREVQRIMRTADRIERSLHGLPAQDQNLILAHLLALWLAGHFIKDEINQVKRPATAKLRDILLDAHVHVVREMLPDCEKLVLEHSTGIESIGGDVVH
jgi:hypothetical protein